MNFKFIRWIDKYAGVPLVYTAVFFIKIFRVPARGRKTVTDKILLVKFWGIGNIMMLLPAASALGKKYPGAGIDILTLKSNEEVAKCSGLFRNIHLIDTSDVFSFAASSLKSFLDLRREKHELIIDFEQFARFSSLFCLLIGGSNRTGFHTKGQHRERLYTQPVPYNNRIHMVESFFTLIRVPEWSHRDFVKPEKFRGRPDRAGETRLSLRKPGIAENDVLVIFHTGTSENFSLRRWPAEYFVRLADLLTEHFGVKIIFTGVPEENDLAGGILSRVHQNKKTANFCGDTSFQEFADLIRKSDLVVSADTSAVHIASYFSVPVVGLYGPNTPHLYGPWGKGALVFYEKLSCSPCITNYNAKMNRCVHPEGQGACMKRIRAEDVFRSIKSNYFDSGAPYRIKKHG